jgi:hypothetical protein
MVHRPSSMVRPPRPCDNCFSRNGYLGIVPLHGVKESKSQRVRRLRPSRVAFYGWQLLCCQPCLRGPWRVAWRLRDRPSGCERLLHRLAGRNKRLTSGASPIGRRTVAACPARSDHYTACPWGRCICGSAIQSVCDLSQACEPLGFSSALLRREQMKLTPPKQITWTIALILGVVGILACKVAGFPIGACNIGLCRRRLSD